MVAPVHWPSEGINRENFEAFVATVAGSADNDADIVIDCSDFEFISATAMRVFEKAARRGRVILLNASPGVRLLAAVYGLETDEPHDAVVISIRRQRPLA